MSTIPTENNQPSPVPPRPTKKTLEERKATMAANAAEIDHLEKVTTEQLNLGIALARE
jgi:hypothetical protein